MSEPHTLPDQGADDPTGGVAQLAAQVSDLRAAVEELRRRLDAEVRTRSVVVVDDDGFERVVLAARGDHGAISVFGRTAPGSPTCAELFANDPADGDGAHAGWAVTDGGDVVAVLDVIHGEVPQLHVERPHDPP